jgi:hypothetical protein
MTEGTHDFDGVDAVGPKRCPRCNNSQPAHLVEQDGGDWCCLACGARLRHDAETWRVVEDCEPQPVFLPQLHNLLAYGIAAVPLDLPVTTTGEAERVVAAILERRDKAKELRDRVKVLTDRANALIADCDSDEKIVFDCYEARLRAFVLAHLPKNRKGEFKSKTLKLLTGKANLRDVPGGLRVKDDEKAVKWAEQQAPEIRNALLAVNVQMTPIADAFKAYYEARLRTPDGCEVPDGCIVEPDKESFRVS